jgi:hypothetical protein
MDAQVKIAYQLVGLFLIALGGIVFIIVTASLALGSRPSNLPPCASEDGVNCYWDADTMGNGEGTDSVVIEP